MRKIMFVGMLSVLFLSGVTLAQQSEERQKDSSMQGMMQEMMKGEKRGEGSMGGMGGMMRMMKMMEQCSAMMEQCCQTTGSGETKDGPKK